MSGKTKPVEGEEYEFEVPDFDEDKFIHKEVVGFQSTLVLFVVGIIAALITYAVAHATDGSKMVWFLGLALVAVGTMGMKTLLGKLKIDVAEWGRRNTVGTAFLLFFTWLAFAIVFLNPPASDFTDPEVQIFATPGTQSVGQDLMIVVFATDESSLKSVEIDVSLNGVTVLDGNSFHAHHGKYTYEGTLPEGSYVVTATAADVKGHTTTMNSTFEVSPTAVAVKFDKNANGTGQLLEDTDRMLVTYKGEDGVQAWIDFADGRSVPMPFDTVTQSWAITKQYAGFRSGDNLVSVRVTLDNHFHGGSEIISKALTTDSFTVHVEGDVGALAMSGKEVKHPSNINPHMQNTPGFEVPAMIAVLGAVLFVARRR